MKHGNDNRERIKRAVAERYGSQLVVSEDWPGLDELTRMAEHRSHRKFEGRPVEAALLQLLFACAFSAPSKSDLQQADIVRVAERARKIGRAHV